ncbi:DNA mismatch repair protein MutS [Eremococcus coleocola]|uniref:DNA mismatch repair protein MutS n=1 Tax=Eremococcus coleocola TaxID=88132 RepID=UPI00041FB8E3|nr:DNA mismatch repair protein MutS [Eremococcus coleocola]
MGKVKKTPMMEQYDAVKERYPDCFIFFRLGDFYEMFNEDALQASKILEITLTSRNKNVDNPIPMCGVPYHSADDYIKTLVQAGHKVAICEQLEDPKLTKGMVKRGVIKVITPGTIMQEKALNQKENNYIACLKEIGEFFYLSYCDVSTGEVFLTQGQEMNQLINELEGIQVSELVYPDSINPSLLEFLKANLKTHFSVIDDQAQASPSLMTKLSKSLTSDQAEAGLACLNLLLAYVESVQMQDLDHFQAVNFYQIIDYLQMTPYTKSQLELSRSLRSQRKKGSLLWYLDRTKTAMGGRLLHQWLDKPLQVKEPLLQRHDKVQSLIENYFHRLDLESALDKIYDLERLVTKISLGHANARDMIQLKQSLQQIPYLNKVIAALRADGQDAFNPLASFDTLVKLLEESLEPDPPLSVTEGNIIRDGYHQQLDKYRDALNHGQQWLVELQQREREKTGLKTLKVGYNKVFGYYIEISRLQAAQLEDPRYQRKQTLANNERFITEELKDIETTILEAQDKAKLLEYELFVAIRQDLSRHIPTLQSLAKQVAELDILCAFASLAEEENFCRPQIIDQPGQLELEESRHPVIEQMIGPANFVANNLKVSPDKYLLLLTGPNMSGKSTFMRQVAYAVILNQIGSFVPAKLAKLPIVDKIFTRIGSADDISRGQSTFMVEMMETNEALQEASSRSLLLFDEIGRGTATYDGMALAQGIIEYIADKVRALTIFSTHYHELTNLATESSNIRNIHVGASEKNGELIFLHKIFDGPADKSYGIHVARLAGLPESLIQNSQAILFRLEEKAKKMDQNEDQQLSLFDQESLDSNGFDVKQKNPVSPLLENLTKANLNQMTPLDTMVYLAKLQNQAQELLD